MTTDAHDDLQAAIDSWPNKPWLILPGPTDISPGLVNHILAALTSAGWAVVKLPTADEMDEALGDAGVAVRSDSLGCNVATYDEFGSTWRSVSGTRQLAAALLAAAKAAEAEK